MKITIDALHLLLLGEISLILLIMTVFLFVRNRRHKSLYQKVLKELSEIKSREQEAVYQQETKVADEVAQVETPPAEEKHMEMPEEKPAVSEAFEMPQSVDETVDEGSLIGKINKLQKIVNFQKDKIVDLMCYKDILEGAQRKLSSVQSGYQELRDRFIKLFGDPPENKSVADAMEVFENNNKELSSYIEILAKENETLAEKFARWENELKQIWETVEKSEIVDEGQYSERLEELMREKEELVARLKEFEDKLQEKTKVFDEMQKQYEDLEKEYMILYRQQQQQG
ncbi:hypothetical protein A45J_1952 [hot springs metagenome]|uniref:Uncharacterized protein n=1 Tax=hot springs metagenome TaxID=433727 RepID=A0A5J4L4P3_9ZZZZ